MMTAGQTAATYSVRAPGTTAYATGLVTLAEARQQFREAHRIGQKSARLYRTADGRTDWIDEDGEVVIVVE